MKNLFLILILLFSMNIYSQKMDKYDLLINKIQVREQSDMMIKQIVDAYAKQKSNIPITVWEEIKKMKLNATFIVDIKNLFKRNYTVKEVDALIATIDKYGVNAYKPKPEVTQKMYDIGKVFGKEIGNQIRAKLSSLGY